MSINVKVYNEELDTSFDNMDTATFSKYFTAQMCQGDSNMGLTTNYDILPNEDCSGTCDSELSIYNGGSPVKIWRVCPQARYSLGFLGAQSAAALCLKNTPETQAKWCPPLQKIDGTHAEGVVNSITAHINGFNDGCDADCACNEDAKGLDRADQRFLKQKDNNNAPRQATCQYVSTAFPTKEQVCKSVETDDKGNEHCTQGRIYMDNHTVLRNYCWRQDDETNSRPRAVTDTICKPLRKKVSEYNNQIRNWCTYKDVLGNSIKTELLNKLGKDTRWIFVPTSFLRQCQLKPGDHLLVGADKHDGEIVPVISIHVLRDDDFEISKIEDDKEYLQVTGKEMNGSHAKVKIDVPCPQSLLPKCDCSHMSADLDPVVVKDCVLGPNPEDIADAVCVPRHQRCGTTRCEAMPKGAHWCIMEAKNLWGNDCDIGIGRDRDKSKNELLKCPPFYSDKYHQWQQALFVPNQWSRDCKAREVTSPITITSGENTEKCVRSRVSMVLVTRSTSKTFPIGTNITYHGGRSGCDCYDYVNDTDKDTSTMLKTLNSSLGNPGMHCIARPCMSPNATTTNTNLVLATDKDMIRDVDGNLTSTYKSCPPPTGCTVINVLTGNHFDNSDVNIESNINCDMNDENQCQGLPDEETCNSIAGVAPKKAECDGKSNNDCDADPRCAWNGEKCSSIDTQYKCSWVENSDGASCLQKPRCIVEKCGSDQTCNNATGLCEDAPSPDTGPSDTGPSDPEPSDAPGPSDPEPSDTKPSPAAKGGAWVSLLWKWLEKHGTVVAGGGLVVLLFVVVVLPLFSSK